MSRPLYVIAGHGGRDPGAVRGALIERDLNIAVVLAFNDTASRDWMPGEVHVWVTPASDPRDGDTLLQERIDRLRFAPPTAIVVDVHHNANASGTGAQVWVSQRTREKPADVTWSLAPALATALGKFVGEVGEPVQVPIIQSDRSRFGKLGILDDIDCTALLVEVRSVDRSTGADGNYAAGAMLANTLGALLGWPRRDRLARAKELAAQIVSL